MSELKNNELFMDGIPFSKWTHVEHQKWQNETVSLLSQCGRINEKLVYLAKLKGWIR